MSSQQSQQKTEKSKKIGSSSSHSTPSKPKRPFSEVAESSAEELVLINHQMEELSCDMKLVKENLSSLKSKSDEMMNKQEMQAFITKAVETILIDINKSLEMSIDLKVEEKTKDLRKKLHMLEEENSNLKKSLHRLKEDTLKANTLAEQSLSKANYNEQYSRKNNVKIMNIEEKPGESEETLLEGINSVLAKHNTTIQREAVVAIHRIPAANKSVKPVLLKFRNNTDKSRLMRCRTPMKKSGHRLVDDVTRLNTELISRLNNHSRIESAWFFNGHVFGKTIGGARYKFDIYDDIDRIISISK